MRWRIGLLGAVALLLVGWVAQAWSTSQGPNLHDFRTTVATCAQGALSAVRTAQLAGRAELDGRAVETYTTPVLDNAIEGVGTAQQRLTGTPPPGPAEAVTRDELARLLDESARTLHDLVAALDRGDDPAASADVDALGRLGDRLADFLEEHPT